MNFITLSRVNSKVLSVLVLLCPLTFITGNLLLNINMALICLLGLLNYKKEIFSLDQIKLKSIFLLFFIFIIITTIVSSKSIGNEEGVLKSLFYLRYFVLLLVIKYMFENNDIDIKKFLIICLIVTSFISLDVTFQSITGKNIFGFEGLERHNSSVFGKELVAGSYIQRFFLFGFIFLALLLTKIDNKKTIFIGLILSLFFSGILLSGNRMPLIMFVFLLIAIFFLIKQLRKAFIMGMIFSSLIFFVSIVKNENVKTNYESFYENSVSILLNLKKFSAKKYPELEGQKDKNFVGEYTQGKDKEKLQAKYEILPIGSGHQAVFLTAIDTWNDNIFLGNGLKSFRVKCKTKLHLPNRVCTSHTHNYYFELLNDTGLIGTLIFLYGIYLLIRKKLKKLENLKNDEKLFLFCILILICAEFFPFRSSGNFFTTSNSFYIFFLLGLLSGFKKIPKIS